MCSKLIKAKIFFYRASPAQSLVWSFSTKHFTKSLTMALPSLSSSRRRAFCVALRLTREWCPSWGLRGRAPLRGLTTSPRGAPSTRKTAATSPSGDAFSRSARTRPATRACLKTLTSLPVMPPSAKWMDLCPSSSLRSEKLRLGIFLCL